MNKQFPNDRIVRFEPTCNLETVRDGRGGIFTWVPDEPIMEWNMLICNPSKIRGNHYHEEFIEYFLVVHGYGVMVTVDENQKETMFHLSKGQCLRTPIGVPHAFYAIEASTAMAFLTKPWDTCKNPITHQQVL